MKKLFISLLLFSLVVTASAGTLTDSSASQVQAALNLARSAYQPNGTNFMSGGYIKMLTTTQLCYIVYNTTNLVDSRPVVERSTSNIVEQTLLNYVPTQAHGLIYIHDGTNKITTANSATYYPLINFTTNGATNVTCTTSNIVLTIPGVYFLDASLSFAGYNTATYELALFVNGVHNDIGEANTTAISSVASSFLSLISYCVVTNTTTIDLRIQGSANQPCTIQQSVIRVHKIN